MDNKTVLAIIGGATAIAPTPKRGTSNPDFLSSRKLSPFRWMQADWRRSSVVSSRTYHLQPPSLLRMISSSTGLRKPGESCRFFICYNAREYFKINHRDTKILVQRKIIYIVECVRHNELLDHTIMHGIFTTVY